MKTCGNCGLGIDDNNDLISCFKYKTLSNSQEDKTSCAYFIEKVLEDDDEPLPPIQHLFLVEEQFKERKMKISINHGLRM